LLGDLKKELNTVGRLDSDSEGLIILTNDGEFINMMTHPKHGVWKTYRVWLKGRPSDSQLHTMKAGMELDGERLLPVRIKILKPEAGNTLLEVSIREGKNRQIRRMFEAVGSPVRNLKRIAVGSLKLGKIEPGKWRELKSYEVSKLISEAKSAD
jgi:23S rRNA pseudouridine2605 synthase